MKALIMSGAIVLGVGPAFAQEAIPTLNSGDWVRVSTRAFNLEPEWRVGALATITPAYVVIEPIGAGPLAIPHQSLTRFELRWGRRNDAVPLGVAGGVLGLVLSATLVAFTDCGPACLLATGAGATAGVVVGRGRSRIHWRAIPPSRIKPHVIARRF